MPTEDRYKQLTPFQRLWILNNMEKDADEERQFYESLSNSGKNTMTFGKDEGPGYETVVSELKKIM